MGPLPRAAEHAAIAGLQAKRCPTSITPDDFFVASNGLRDRFAQLSGAPDPSHVAIVPSVSYGVSTAARNTRLGNGRNVVVVHEQFPSNMYPWRRLAAEQGGVVRVVRPPDGKRDGEAWTEAIVGEIDAGTAVVAVETVHWTDGTPFGVEAIADRARDVGAAFVVDATQSAGAAPIDVQTLQPDALLAAGYKFLLGPYSVSLAYFGDRYLDGVPLEEGWTVRRGARDFRGLVDYVDEYEPGAVRFDMGQRSNFALVPALSASLDLILEWGPARTSSYCRTLSDRAAPRLRELGFGVSPASSRSPHLFGVRLPTGVTAVRVQKSLDRFGVSASLRGAAIRVSPFVYNTEDDMDAFVDALAFAAKSLKNPAADRSTSRPN